MSRTQPKSAGTRTPAKKFLEWKSMLKAWAYYDKEAKQEVTIPHGSLAFIVLDQLNTVKGYDERAQSGMWANEVRSLRDEQLTVRTKSGIKCEGFYDDIKGGDLKFTKSVYVMAKIDGEYELANLQLSGAALGAWFEFCEAAGNLEGDIVVSAPKTVEGKKGAVTYNMPGFEIVSRTLSPEAAEQADEMDRTLQDYLTAYFAGNAATSGGTSEPSAAEVQQEKTIDRGRDAVEEMATAEDESMPF